ncbi:MAG TPA: type II toxin-antitoxin system death-on-curing family toxin [Blastocatellia bacterium]|nr:type II toxin-antitoxin system death-on-curing family toxin [Blastocatellia bacterium]
MDVIFPRKDEVLKYHSWLIERFGGSHGVRDEGALESALAAARNRHHYEEADLIICAATYACHLSQAHAFIDGNKRIAAAVAELFLNVNGVHLKATSEEEIELFLGIAAGQVSRDEVERVFAQWAWSRE